MRSRRWLVEAVEDVAPPASPRVSLACADDDAQGQTLEVYWDFEIDRRILEQEAWSSIGAKGFDAPRHFSAFLHTLRWNCVTATDPNLFQSPFRAGIRIDAYQMEPLRKALRLPRVNLFIADDTGLGKTIEAGLIARELLLRKKARTIVVAAPASVLEQWKAEMEERFGLLFVILDRAYLTRVRQERGFGVNPWRTHSCFLVSHNLLIDPTYADPMREWLGEMQPGSLLILDEAHHAAPSSGGRYGIETKFTRAIRDLGGRFEHRLFLSATPHNGHSNSFSTLLELLDPYRFTRGVPVRGKNALEDVMVRRIKEDIREFQGGFPERVVRRIPIEDLPEDAPELLLSRLLDEYRGLREERLKNAPARARAAAGLLVVGLQQKLLSSIEAFAISLARHRTTVRKQWERAMSGEAAASGRRAGAGAGARQRLERVRPPLISDGAVYRVLEKLLVLDGERISYRTLDVEQIGSVYETIMGFRMEIATGRSVAIKPAKKLGAPSTIDLDALLAQGTGSRAKWLQPRTDRNLTDTVAKGLRAAETVEDLHAALAHVLDKDATPDLVPTGALVLQPNEERRRSGSHYTPRELTEPIVRHTLAPILERLRGEDGRAPTPARILDIKVCDPAMGSGAFLVETCRQLADALIDA